MPHKNIGNIAKQLMNPVNTIFSLPFSKKGKKSSKSYKTADATLVSKRTKRPKSYKTVDTTLAGIKANRKRKRMKKRYKGNMKYTGK